jgi:glycosyltransferase involved in cell wall biosynthesis
VSEHERQLPAGDAHEPVPPIGPWFSIIIPVWNRAGTIRRCLDSVLAQSFQDFEIVAVDGASADASFEVMREYTDKRVRLFRHEKNRGMVAARWTAITNARGRWIVQLDSDDALMEGALERFHRMALEASPAVGVIAMPFVYDDGSVSPVPAFPEGDVGFEGWLKWLDGATRVDFLFCYRRAVFEEIHMCTDGRHAQQFMMQLISRWKMRVDLEPGGLVYSDAPNPLHDRLVLVSTSTKQAHARCAEEILAEFGPIIRRLAPRRYRRLHFEAGWWYLWAGDRRRGARWMLKYLVQCPFSWLGWGSLVLGFMGPGALLWARQWSRRRRGAATA